MAKPFAWSYSRLTTYEQCPKKFWEMNIAKSVKETPSDQQNWGEFVHKAFELRVTKKVPLPAELSRHEDLVQALTAGNPREISVERNWALDRNLRPTGWFDANVWCRFKGDFIRIDNGPPKTTPTDRAILVDYKTGKLKEDDTQLQLGACFAFEYYPTLEQVRSLYVWLKEDDVSSIDINRRDKPKVWSELMPRVQRMEKAYAEGDMPAQPGPLCHWCPVVKCVHNPKHVG